MERLTFFCLGETAYLTRSYQLIISSGNYCPAGCGLGRSIDVASMVQIFSTRVYRWMQPANRLRNRFAQFFLQGRGMLYSEVFICSVTDFM